MRYPGRDWEAKWGVYFYFCIGDGDEGGVGASCWLKEPGPAMKKVMSLGVQNMETSGSMIWIFEAIGESPDGFAAAMHRALDTWIEVWRKVGGLQQFLPLPKLREVQAGK